MLLTTRFLKVIFVIIYLVVDLSYVLGSRGFYESYARAIQGSGFPAKRYNIAFALSSYLFMALAWWFLVASQITPSTRYTEAVFYAVILGLGIYGVFNGTLYVMFNKWDYRVVIRDTVWGVSWLSILTLAYTMVLKKIVR